MRPSHPHPRKKFTPKDHNVCNLRLSRSHFYVNKVSCPHCHWLEPPQWCPHTLNDWSPQQAPSNSSAHSPLVTSKLKVRSCNVCNQDQELQHHETAHQCVPGFFISSQFQASLFPHKLSLLAQLVFFCKVIFIIPMSMSLFGVAQQFF